MNRFTLTCFTAFAVTSVLGDNAGLRLHGNAAGGESAVTKKTQQHSLVVQAADTIEQELVICNAYASEHPLDILHCNHFTVALQEGDQLDFKAKDLDVGSFYATGLPKSQTSLLLIPHRRTPHAIGVSFESHAFTDSRIPQIAVIDAYRSKKEKESDDKQGVKLIQQEESDDSTQKNAKTIEEDLIFNSVVAVNPGDYKLALMHSDKTLSLHASGATKYVVMRIGVEGEEKKGGHYQEELVVFPNGAPRSVSSALIALAVALLGLMS